VSVCLPAAPALPIAWNEKFGTFSFYRQRSGKRGDLLWVQRTALEMYAPAVGNEIPHPILGVGFVDLLQLLKSVPGPDHLLLRQANR